MFLFLNKREKVVFISKPNHKGNKVLKKQQQKPLSAFLIISPSLPYSSSLSSLYLPISVRCLIESTPLTNQLFPRLSLSQSWLSGKINTFHLPGSCLFRSTLATLLHRFPAFSTTKRSRPWGTSNFTPTHLRQGHPVRV